MALGAEHLRKWQFLAALLTALVVSLTSLASARLLINPRLAVSKFEFALIGDLPYNSEQETKFLNLIEDINHFKLAFVVHDGDFKSGATPCSNQIFLQRRNLFQTFQHPFIFIPGDNEWTDCHRTGFAPLERLAKLRETFFQGSLSLGKPSLKLNRQSDDPKYQAFRENVWWSYSNVMFVGLNVVGSNNNFGRTAEADQEYAQRNAANLSWMQSSFTLAKRDKRSGIMLIIQANPGFELSPNDPNRTGFNDFLAALESETLAFGKPVILVHGDTHYFRVDKPLLNSHNQRRIQAFTRVETFGSPDVHWLKSTVDPQNPNLFSFEPVLVQKNL